MMLRRLRRSLLPCLAVLLPWAGLFGAANPRSQVQASLVAADASVQPGRPLAVALRLVHDPHWHTYWVNPGTGLRTTIEWKLPPGWQAGEIQWPAPRVLKDKTGAVIGHGYEEEIFLPITLTPPADLKSGERIELHAVAEWLMCEDVCEPGEAQLALTLPASSDAPQPDRQWGAKVRSVIANLPQSDPAWKLSAQRLEKTIALNITRADNAPAHTPRSLHFFSDNNLVGYDLPQSVKPDGRGGFVLTLQVSSDGPPDATHLTGVITSDNGWRANGQMPGLRVDIPLEKSPAPVTSADRASGSQLSSLNSQPTSGLAGTLVLAFIGGLILNLMPCVFPVLGIKILGFVNQAGHDRGKVVAHGLVFTLGVLLSFWTLAGVLAVLRAGGDELGWGFQLQSPAFVYALTVVMLVFGLNMSGVFEFGLRATAVGSDLQSKSGYSGSFFTGVLATVVATPCSAPFLAPALGAALAVSTVQSFGIFTAIALGLSAPYLLLSIFPRAVKMLPRPGAWMETFKQFMAFPLYATAGYLVWVLAAQTSEEGFRGVLFSLVLVAMAVWMYGRWHAPGASLARARLGLASLVVVGACGLWLGWPRSAIAQPAAGAAPRVVWQPWSPEAVATLRAENRIVYVDFTARWCATCQTNKKLVFSSDEVLRAFAEKKVAALRADWTSKDPRITAELARYHRSAVPFNVIWVPGRNEPIILPELLTPRIVLDALKNADGPANSAGTVVKSHDESAQFVIGECHLMDDIVAGRFSSGT